MENVKKVEVERIITVLKTNDYERFVMNELNRDINKRTVDNFIKDFENDGYCTLFPIIVKEQDDKYLIIKGHHRYLACRTANIPVYFMIDNSLTDEDIIKGEKTQREFKAKDCTDIYAKMGKEVYVKFKRLTEESGLKESIASKLMFGFSNHGGLQRKFIDEKIVIDEETERAFRIKSMNYKRLGKCCNLYRAQTSDWNNIMFILENSELTMKFAKYLHYFPYDISKSKTNFKRLFNKTYEEDLKEKLSNIEL